MIDPFHNLPKRHFGSIAADPPWRYETYSAKNQTRAAANHYDVMTLDDIKAMPVADLAKDDCCLFLWCINPMLPQGFEVLSAWGFTFKTLAFCWAKTTSRTHQSWAPKYHVGLGHWSRANVEICLLGTRGRPKRLAKDVRQLIVEPRREHSRKPEQFFKSVERLASGPYLELFSRTEREGWSTFGNETGKFNEVAA